MSRQLRSRTLVYTRSSPQRASGRTRRAPYRGMEHDLQTRHEELAVRPERPPAARAAARLRTYSLVAGAGALAALGAAVLAAIAGIAAAVALLAGGVLVALVAAAYFWYRWNRAASALRGGR